MIRIDNWENPEFLYALFIIPVLIVWYWFKHKDNSAELRFSSMQTFGQIKPTLKTYFFHSLFILRIIAISLIIIAMARPQSVSKKQNVNIEGIDIVMTLDVSGSMLARDFKPDRLEAAKEVAKEFIAKRPNDRVSLVIFSGEAFTQVPLTTDHQMISNIFEEVKSGMIEDGTAIGDGLATSVSRLENSEAISKVIILITDGVNNAGSVDPISAAELANMFGIRVYTIGIGSMGTAPYPVQTPFGIQMQEMEVQIDEELLQKIAAMTGGRYFRADNNKKLREIYKEIDTLEKSKIDIQEFRKKHEAYLPFALIALLILVIEITLRYIVFKRFP
ncbi:MAG: VWA domain-containing protein [Lentimicrobiaceae bacterium]|jgi:Ca-activated chloride channel family protein|nr:VWA domain-containing protein [Lentimicrobiaceae bacterium]MCP4910206.1 VWA domain-containing protein [Bacteroidota bacterium]MBT3453759.1 VWA domain-containing protein [Lentimicrobiaceae bacterium]MBT3819438.1 VWA domain-containing protein [Lentimicrobiaceae bacterium]MBT4062162.1 VWA domain-containing protein [Lentimicrobiaceae bacterium]